MGEERARRQPWPTGGGGAEGIRLRNRCSRLGSEDNLQCPPVLDRGMGQSQYSTARCTGRKETLVRTSDEMRTQ